jgi:hypothetical protein
MRHEGSEWAGWACPHCGRDWHGLQRTEVEEVETSYTLNDNDEWVCLDKDWHDLQYTYSCGFCGQDITEEVDAFVAVQKIEIEVG